jgi:hypothetical protein
MTDDGAGPSDDRAASRGARPGALRDVSRSLQSIALAAAIFVGLAVGIPWVVGLFWK